MNLPQESGFSYDESSEPSEISNDILFREGVNQRVIPIQIS